MTHCAVQNTGLFDFFQLALYQYTQRIFRTLILPSSPFSSCPYTYPLNDSCALVGYLIFPLHAYIHHALGQSN